MTTPTIVKVLARPRLEPLEDRVRRIVALSDGTQRMERWDFRQGAWIICPYDGYAYDSGFTLSDAECRTLGILPDDLDGTASRGT